MKMVSQLKKMKAVVGLAIASAAVVVAPQARASGIPTVDLAAIVQMVTDYGVQLDQYAENTAQTLQMYTDYRLQLENLQSLPGNVRNQVLGNLQNQISNNVNDYGSSFLNSTVKIDPNSANYYGTLETMMSTAMDGSMPRTLASTNVDLSSVGITSGTGSSIGQQSYKDRVQWERVMDDMRQVSLTRKNSETRADQARGLANQMANLPANNTVGAIQLLAAQNSLSYAQQEDLIKNQSTYVKVVQEQQARELAAREKYRRLELERLARAQAGN